MKKCFSKILLTLIVFPAYAFIFSLQAHQTLYPKTITVAQDSTGDYTTIQQAVNSTRDLGKERVIIYIKRGVYHEKLVIPSWKTSISLIGENQENTVISNNDYSGKAHAETDLHFSGNKFNTFTTYTVLVQGNDFVAQNLTIENTSGPVGQAVALHVEGDRCVIINCRILGNQDTLYAATEKSRQFYLNCYMEGTTDFIFGEATAVFQNCTIRSLSNSYITAAATTSRQSFGFVLLNCKLVADTTVQKVFLGRPWRPYARTAYIQCELGGHIVPEGWNPWSGDPMFPDKEKTACYREYRNTGPGSSVKGRVPWSKQLSSAEAKTYTVKNILSGADQWNPLHLSQP